MAVTVTARKYNPGFLTDDELVGSFCVRTTEFEMLVEVLRECTGSSNPHQIVIGPRGSGKTSLLLRVAVEVRRDAGLAAAFFPVVFAEESYEVSTAGEFWLECLSHLSVQAPRRDDGPDLQRTFAELRTVRDDRTLAERCLGALLDFSDREGKRLVLLVENLNMLFRDMADPDAGWRLRKVLQTEPRIVLLASATSRFDEIDDPDHALYDLFSVRTLRPLDTGECATLWEAVAGRCPQPGTIRSIEILTGGSPRLVAIVARFGAELSFRTLMASLLDLIDDHTEYFKSHLELLPAQERRVYLALAALWKPATTREIADQSRMETSKCSAQLTRLTGRGVVQSAGGSARRKQYYLTERLYNIYYLMRRSRRSDRLVEALIHFMESYYSPSELKDIGVRIIREVDSFGEEMQSLSKVFLTRLIELPALAGSRQELLAMITQGFVKVLDQGSALPEVVQTTSTGGGTSCGEAGRANEKSDAHAEWVAIDTLYRKAIELARQGRAEDALVVCEEIVRRFGESDTPAVLARVAAILAGKGGILGILNRKEEALVTCDEVVRLFGQSDVLAVPESVAMALYTKGSLLDSIAHSEQALVAYEDLLLRFEQSEDPAVLEWVAKVLVNKGTIFNKLNRSEDALAIYEEAMRRFGQSDTPSILESIAMVLVNKGVTLVQLNQPEDALVACDEVVNRFGESDAPFFLEQVAKALMNKGITLVWLNRPEDALSIYNEVVDRFGMRSVPALCALADQAILKKGELELRCKRYEEAVETIDRALDLFGTESQELRLRGHLVRARAMSAGGGGLACERDVEAILALLAETDFPKNVVVLHALVLFSDTLGIERMCELIKASPSRNLLLPLTTALELERGLQPRVAREVKEVAEDIRRHLRKLREAGVNASP